MKLVVGLVLFLVGINVGFVTAGLMHAAKEEHEQTRDENGLKSCDGLTCCENLDNQKTVWYLAVS